MRRGAVLSCQQRVKWRQWEGLACSGSLSGRVARQGYMHFLANRNI